MSVTKVAHSKRKRKDSSKRLNRPSTIVSTQRVKPKAKPEPIHYGTSWYYGFVRCNGCYDFAPVIHAANYSNQQRNACINCGSHQISYLSTSNGKLFGYLSKYI